jgi:hypothetical protein
MARHVARMGDEKCIKMLVVKPNGKRPLGRPGHRWEDNVKIVSGFICLKTRINGRLL